MVYSGIDALRALRSLAGPGERPGLRLIFVGIVLLVGLLLWGLLVFALGAGWSLAARALVTLLLVGLTGAACFAVLRRRRG